MKIMSWIDWVCEETGYETYDLLLEELPKEEIERLEDEYDIYVDECAEEEGVYYEH